MARAEQQQVPLMSYEFNEYLTQERVLREQSLAQQKTLREECFDKQADRQIADTEAARISPCDGSSTSLVREWLEEVEMSKRYTARTVYVATHASRGALRKDIERFLDNQDDEEEVTWAKVRQHVEESFLTPMEEVRLRKEMLTIEQFKGETLATFNRRYVEKANKAYPKTVAGGRSVDAERTLLEEYIRALADDSLVDHLVTVTHPTTVDQAIEQVTLHAKETYRLRLARTGKLDPETRMEEPMEIGALEQAPRAQAASWKKPSATTAPWQKAYEDVSGRVDGLQNDFARRMDGMAKQLTKMMAKMELQSTAQATGGQRHGRNGPRAAPAPARLQFTEDGSPICAYCHREGHIAKQCRTKRAHQQANQRSTGGPYYQGGH